MINHLSSGERVAHEVLVGSVTPRAYPHRSTSRRLFEGEGGQFGLAGGAELEDVALAVVVGVQLAAAAPEDADSATFDPE